MGDILVAKCSSYYYSTLYKRFPKATEEKSKSQQSERSLHVSMSLWSHLQHFQLLIYTLVMSMYLKFSHTLLHSLACFACAVCSVRKAFFPWLTLTHLSMFTSSITFSETGLPHWIKYPFVSSKHSVPTYISLTQHLL